MPRPAIRVSLTFLRSSAKPLQALPLVRARPDLADREIAIACASHRAPPEQLDAVRALLAAAPATEADLETGPEPTPLEHNCSGKHAGFLAVCRARGFETARLPARDASAAARRCSLEVAAAAEVDPDAMPIAVDGCGVPTFALPLDRCAHAFARLPRLDGGSRVVAAMRAHPEMLRGPVAADVMFMRALPGLGREGRRRGSLLCRFGRWSGHRAEGRGRSLPGHSSCTCHLFGSSSALDPGELGIVTVENSRGEPVGAVRTR